MKKPKKITSQLIPICLFSLFISVANSAEKYLPKNCSEKKESLEIKKKQISCNSDQSEFVLKIKEGYLNKLNSTLKDWSWVERKIEQLTNLRTFELKTYKPLYRHLAFDDAPTSEVKKQHRKFKSDFDFLLQTTKDIDVAQKQINILQKDKIGYIAPDLFERYKQLQALKISILNRNPILGGEEIEKLIKSSIEKDNVPTPDTFNESLKSDLQKYLLNQRDTVDKYAAFKRKSEYKFDRSGEQFKSYTDDLASNNFEIINDIFSSGVADEDFNDPLFTQSACGFLNKMYAEQKKRKMKNTAIEVSLFVAPFLLGEVGLVSRALNLGKLLRFGTFLSQETASLLPRLMSGGVGVASLGLNVSEINDLKESCKKQYGLYGLKPSQDSYNALKNCREEYDTKLIIAVSGVGLVSGAVVFKNLSLPLKASFINNLQQGPQKKSSVLKLLAKDFGVGQGKLIKEEIASMEKFTLANKEKLAAFSPQVINKENEIRKFVNSKNINKEVGSHKVIPKEELIRYSDEIGKDTIEYLYIPGADVPHLPSSINKVGHVAMRIGDKVYHQTGGAGFKIESFDNFINNTKKNYKVFGSVLQVSPKEKEVMKEFFNKMYEKQLPYSFLLNNCAQASCRALSLAEIKNVTNVVRHDPVLTSALIKRSERVVLQTAYNVEKDLTPAQLKVATASNRAAFYGIPVAAVGVMGFAGVEAVDMLIDYVDQIQMPSQSK